MSVFSVENVLKRNRNSIMEILHFFRVNVQDISEIEIQW